MVVLDVMTIGCICVCSVLTVVEDLRESLVVAVVALYSVICCSVCGYETVWVYETREVKVCDCRCRDDNHLVWHGWRFRCGR